MELYFLRHGEAEDYALDDHARALTPHGRIRLQTATKVIQKLDVRLTHLYTSPRIRALQTAQIVGEGLGMTPEITEYLNFGFSLASLKMLIAPCDDEARVMLVGHEPTFSHTIHELTNGRVEMKRGGLVRVTAPKNHLKMGILMWAITPKVFDTLAG